MVVRELLVKLGFDTDQASLAEAVFAGKTIETVIGKAIEVAVELGHAFVENVHKTIEYGDNINKLSQKVGVGAEALQGLLHAGQLGGVGMDAMSTAMKILARNMNNAKTAGGEAADAFRGIRYKDAAGNLLPITEVMASAADKFQGMEDGAEKTALAMKLFGKSGADLIPVLNKGSGDLEAMRKEAEDLGLIMDGEAAKAAEELNDDIERLGMTTQGLWRQAIAPLIPILAEAVKQFLKWRKENAAWIKSGIQGVVWVLAKGFKILLAVLELLTAKTTLWTFAVVGLAAAMAALSTVAWGAAIKTALAWALAAAPFVLIGAAIAALLLVFEDLMTYAEGGDSLFGRFAKEIEKWLEPAESDPWWLAAIKGLINSIQEAIALAMKFKATMTEIFSMDTLDALVGNHPGVAKGAIREKDLQDRIRARNSAAAARMAAGGGSNTSNAFSASIGPIYQQPGESGEDLSRRIAESLNASYAEALPAVK